MTLTSNWLPKIPFSCGALLVLCSVAAYSQQTPPAPDPLVPMEWPVTFLENIAAGMTPVGAKVQAKLFIATLVNGNVIPEGAVLSGVVTASQAKSKTDAARLAIRMDTVQWKDNGPFAVKLYLTVWYHPFKSTLNQQGSAPNYDHGKIGIRAPGPENRDGIILQNPDLINNGLVSAQRLHIEKVESVTGEQGEVVLTSQKSNIKLDKAIVYVFELSESH